jgi:UDP-N-acetylglucosamine acyltransferase
VVGWSTLGERNEIHPYACVGITPQDRKYKGERAELVVGNGNTIREHVTIGLGTEGGGGVTRIGDRNLIMSSAHVGHDCVIQNDVVISTGVGLAGHCVIEDFAILGGQSGVHQFVHIGAHSMLGGGSKVNQDIPPYTIAQGYPARLRGVNLIGLKRRGFSEETLRALKQAYRTIFGAQNGRRLDDSIARVRTELGTVSEVRALLAFLDASLEQERGFAHAARGEGEDEETEPDA